MAITSVDPKLHQAAICFVIQNEREIAPWKKTTPLSTFDLNSYIAVKFVTKVLNMPSKTTFNNRLSMLRNQVQTQSLVQVWASSEN